VTAVEFLGFCSNHAEPAVRYAAALACGGFFKDQSDLALDTVVSLLADPEAEVRRAAVYYNDILGGEDLFYTIIDQTGIAGAHRLTTAVVTALATLENQSHTGEAAILDMPAS